MAGEDLYTALQNLNVPATNTGYGIGAVALSQSLPQLVNPTGSVGRNLGVVLGGALMSSLLGYQARKQATEQSLLASTLGSQMLRMKTPEERLALIKGVDDSAIQPRLLDLQSALQGREEANRLGALEAGQRQEALYGALGSEAGEKYLQAQIGAYATKAAATAEQRRQTKAYEADLQERLKSFGTDEKLRFESERDKQEMDLIDAGEDPTIARQRSIALTRAKLQEAINQKQSERKIAEDEFKASLDAGKLAQKEKDEVSNAMSISNMIYDLSSKIEGMSVAEFKAYKNFDALPDSIKSDFADLKSRIGNARYGASLTGNELATLEAIFGNDFTTGPESFARNIRNVANTMLNKAKIVTTNASKSPQDILGDLDAMITTQKPLIPKLAGKAVSARPNVGTVDFASLAGELSSSGGVAPTPTATPMAAPTTDSVEAVDMEERALQQEANRLQEQGLAIPYELGQKAVQLKQRKAALGL